MTRDEFFKKYGHVKVKFESYYKYTFVYKAELPDGKQLTCSYGGDHDSIYRHEVGADCEETISKLSPDSAAVYQDGKEIEGFN